MEGNKPVHRQHDPLFEDAKHRKAPGSVWLGAKCFLGLFQSSQNSASFRSWSRLAPWLTMGRGRNCFCRLVAVVRVFWILYRELRKKSQEQSLVLGWWGGKAAVSRARTRLIGKFCPAVPFTSDITILIKSMSSLHYDCAIIVQCRARSWTMNVFFFSIQLYLRKNYFFICLIFRHLLLFLFKYSNSSVKHLSFVFSPQWNASDNH